MFDALLRLLVSSEEDRVPEIVGAITPSQPDSECKARAQLRHLHISFQMRRRSALTHAPVQTDTRLH